MDGGYETYEHGGDWMKEALKESADIGTDLVLTAVAGFCFSVRGYHVPLLGHRIGSWCRSGGTG